VSASRDGLGTLAALKEATDAIPYFAVIAALWIAILVAEIAFLVVARRRAARWLASDAPPASDSGTLGPGLDRMVIAGPILFLVVVALSTMTARARLLVALAAPTTEARLAAVSDNLGALMTALSLATLPASPLVLLAALSLAALSWTRSRARGEGSTSEGRFTLAALAVVGVGLVPLGAALLRYTAYMIKIGTGVAGVDPELKALMWRKGMEEAQDLLTPWALASAVGLAVTIAAIAFAWLRAARRHAAAPDPAENRRALRRAAGLFAAAMALLAAALPFRSENVAPWPEASHNALLNVGAFETSPLVGPDPVPWAPVLIVQPGKLLVEGSGRAPGEILQIVRRNYELLHPGEPFPGEISVSCVVRTPAAELDRALAIAAAAGYVHPSLVFAHPGVVHRPLLGAVPRATFTAAAMTISDREGEGALDVASAGTCGAFAERVVAGRRRGDEVRLKLAAGAPAAREDDETSAR
jgi:hypothetical protein